MIVNQIEYPEKPSEFDIQAETYMALRNEGYDVRGNVKAWCDDFGKHHRCYLDLVVFDAYQMPLLIVECKDHDNGSMDLSEGSRQHRRYHKFGLPVMRVGSIEQIELVIHALQRKELEADKGVSEVASR